MEPHCFIRNRKPVTPPTQWRKAEPPPSSAPPAPPFDIETMETIEPPWQAIKEWIPDDEPDLNWFNQERPPSDSEPDQFDQSPAWQPEEVPLGDGRTLVLEDF